VLLLQAGYRYVPYCSLERIIEESKDGYYRALRESQKTIRIAEENLDAWVRFFLRSLRKQQELLQHKIELEQRLEKLSPLSAQQRGRLTITEAVTLLEVNRNTAKLHIRQLVENGYLIQHGTGKATWYTLGK